MRCSKVLYRLAAAVTCVAVCFSCGGGALAYNDYFWSSATIGSTASPGSVLVSKYQLYDGDGTGNIVNTQTDEVGFDTSIADLSASCNEGELQASKDGFYASEEDAKNGIVELVIDVVSKSPPEAIDVMFVLDESGSMAMYAVSVNNYLYTVPCLNGEHFYKIEYDYTDKNGGTHSNQVFNLWPNRTDKDNCWNVGSFIIDIKEQIRESISEDLRPSDINHITLCNWSTTYDFAEHHYKKDGENDVQIPKEVRLDMNHGEYYSPSPGNNPDGCIDRQLIAKAAIRDMAQDVLDNNGSNSYIGYTGFAGRVLNHRAMEHSMPDTQLNSLKGYGGTNYYEGLERAREYLKQRLDGTGGMSPKPADQKTIVVFITDGMPNNPTNPQNHSDPTYPTQKALEAATDLKNLDSENLTLYCVGIKSGAAHLLEDMATSPDCFKECNTRDEFEAFLQNITTTDIKKTALVVDELGNGYELFCDTAHPITVKHGASTEGEKAYTTRAAAAEAGITLQPGNKLQWLVKDADEEGNRLSFYVKLKDTAYKSALPGYEGAYPTNKRATVSYHKVTDAAPAGEQNATIFPLDNPATIKVEQSRLTATKASDRLNQVVLPGEELTYIITLKNTGVLDLSNVKVSDELPSETEYVHDSGGTLEGNKVTFSSLTLDKNRAIDYSFRVNVLEGQSKIINYAMFGTDSVQSSLDASGSPACYANLVTNPRPHHVAGGGAPQTGDRATPLLWAALAAVSMLACAVLFKRRKYSA